MAASPLLDLRNARPAKMPPVVSSLLEPSFILEEDGAASRYTRFSHCENYRKYINNEQMSDISFVVGESSTIIYAHRCILGMHSAVFQAMLFGGMRESRQDEIVLEDIEADVFLVFLEYVYTGCVTLEGDLSMIVSLLTVSDKYDVASLKDICNDYLQARLKPDNIFAILDCTGILNSPGLKERCFKMIDKSAPKIFKEAGFLNLCKQTIIEIFARDDLCCYEFDIFEAVMSWAHHSSEGSEPKLRKALEGVIELVRFPLIHPDKICTVIDTHQKFVPDSLLKEAYRFWSVKDPVLRQKCLTVKLRAPMCASLSFEENEKTVQRSSNGKVVTRKGASGHVVLLATESFSTGYHKWAMKIEGLGEARQWISVGVAYTNTVRSDYVDSSHWVASSSGQVFAGSKTDQKNGVLIGNGDVVECLLDMFVGRFEIRNITTNKSVEITVPTNANLYPSIGMHYPGNKITLLDI